MARRTITLALALAFSMVATVAEVPTYSTFELQARSNITDGFNLPANSSFNSKSPALGDDGTIAFTLVSIGGGNAGLFIGSGGVGTTVYTAPTPAQVAVARVVLDESLSGHPLASKTVMMAPLRVPGLAGWMAASSGSSRRQFGHPRRGRAVHSAA